MIPLMKLVPVQIKSKIGIRGVGISGIPLVRTEQSKCLETFTPGIYEESTILYIYSIKQIYNQYSMLTVYITSLNKHWLYIQI